MLIAKLVGDNVVLHSEGAKIIDGTIKFKKVAKDLESNLHLPSKSINKDNWKYYLIQYYIIQFIRLNKTIPHLHVRG